MLVMEKQKKTKGSAIKVVTPVYPADNKKLAIELKLANIEIAFQNGEKEKRADELIIANKELAYQDQEKEKRAAELIIANKELLLRDKEREKKADTLIIANIELAFQDQEKEKRAEELIIANKELVFQNQEKEKRAEELIIANKELAFQNEEKEKRASELILANTELKKAEESHKEYILGLEEIIFITSHKVRQPITQIQGISSLLNETIVTQEEIKEIIQFLKEPIKSLDAFTRELTTYVCQLQSKLEHKNDEDI